MKAPLSWIREYVDLPADVTPSDLAARLTALGLKLEALEHPGADITGPLVVGRVLTMQPEPQSNGKTINWCTVDVGAANGTGEPQGIVCGAHNFAPGDLVVVVLPGGVLPGANGSGTVAISARKTYGHLSAGMICSAKELGLGDDHSGIIVLPADAGEPGSDVRELLHLDDDVIEFEINPDRAYALSLRGVAREAALATGGTFTDPALRATPTPNADGYPVVVDDPEGCPVFVARRVSGFDPAATTPRWMSRRIQLAGMRPISLAVDITNYVMLELGHPIHGYDADKLSGPVRVRRATAGEHLRTLDGADRVLSAEDLVVTDDSGPIGLGGVMGGETTEMSSTTTRILVEVASWNPVAMFRTGKRHKLTSEAGKRNERGVDPTIAEAAADRVVELLATLGGGATDPGVTKVGAAPARAAVSIDGDLSARVTGMAIDEPTVVANLVAVGCSVSGAGRLDVVPPPWRPDINDPFDLVEEVARIVGYANVPSVLPPAPAGRGLTVEQQLRRRVGRTLAGAGYVEVLTFPFVGADAFDALGLPVDDVRRAALRLANPLSAEAPLMTTTLLPGLLETAARNLGRGSSDLALFEAAPVTLPHVGAIAPILPVDRRPTDGEWDDLNKALPDQPLHLGLVLTGEREQTGWWGEGRRATWADAVQGVREVAAAVGVELSVRSAQQAPWHPGRCAEILIGEVSIGFAGELHPRVATSYGVPSRIAVAEVNLSTLLDHAVVIAPAPEFSTYPVAKEDVALVVPDDVPAAAVAVTLREGAGALCESVRLFDVYTGEQVAPGHRSLAF
ncbi:MAG: phenylalanine--tRNA ligase subunit beta, partial [Marmoricola sp.]|nr:phenylalanine--tRNA ligase subunit beta [Marmoricola sp.]